jgi:hypothetical protein
MDLETAALTKAKNAALPQAGTIKKTLDDELKEGDTALTKKMKEEKADFIKKFQKHQIKSTDEDFDKALTQQKSTPNVISVIKQKRDNDDEVDGLEEKTKKSKHNKGGAGEAKRFKKE